MDIISFAIIRRTRFKYQEGLARPVWAGNFQFRLPPRSIRAYIKAKTPCRGANAKTLVFNRVPCYNVSKRENRKMPNDDIEGGTNHERSQQKGEPGKNPQGRKDSAHRQRSGERRRRSRHQKDRKTCFQQDSVYQTGLIVHDRIRANSEARLPNHRPA